MKAFNIIALVLSLVFTIWFIIFIGSDGRISSGEFAPVGLVFGLFCVAYAAVHTFSGKGYKDEKDNWV